MVTAPPVFDGTSPSTESSFRVTVLIPAISSTTSEEWEVSSGGGKTSAVSKVRIGIQPNKTVAIPSVSDSADLSLTRNVVVPHVWALQNRLLELNGKAKVKVWMNPINADGLVDHNLESLEYDGLLTSVQPVQMSNESTSTATIVIGVTGGPWHPISQSS